MEKTRRYEADGYRATVSPNGWVRLWIGEHQYEDGNRWSRTPQGMRDWLASWIKEDRRNGKTVARTIV